MTKALITRLPVFFFFIFSFSGICEAQNGTGCVTAIPYDIKVTNNPVSFSITDEVVKLSARGKTNLFNNPNGVYNVQNAPMALFEPEGDFTLSARVTGKLKSVYDVAALVVYQDGDLWAKLCYENSVNKVPTIVSVVTRKYSDDCNSMSTGDYAYLSVVKKGKEFSFFYSQDGIEWSMIRSFHHDLDANKKLKVGFASHGSRGDGFTAIFSDIKYANESLDNMRGL